MMPAADLDALKTLPAVSHVGFSRPQQGGTFNVIAALDGLKVKFPGYIVRLHQHDITARLYAFLFERSNGVERTELWRALGAVVIDSAQAVCHGAVAHLLIIIGHELLPFELDLHADNRAGRCFIRRGSRAACAHPTDQQNHAVELSALRIWHGRGKVHGCRFGRMFCNNTIYRNKKIIRTRLSPKAQRVA